MARARPLRRPLESGPESPNLNTYMSALVPRIASRSKTPPPTLEAEEARAIVEAAIRRYFRKARARIPAFVEKNYSLFGALDTHRHAFGHDLWRAPLNTALVGPAVVLKGLAWGADRIGRAHDAQWLRTRDIFLKTDVTRELEWRLHADLLRLPYQDGPRAHRTDALAEEVFADPRVAPYLDLLRGPWGERERARLDAALAQSLTTYMNGRIAVAEIANVTATAGAGAALLHQFTPGMLTLGPALAQMAVEHLAHAHLPAGLAAVLIAIAPASPGVTATVTVSGAVLAASAVLSAVAGVVTDPLQKALGLHHRRLVALLDALEGAFLGENGAGFATRSQYVVRLAELADLILAAARFAKG